MGRSSDSPDLFRETAKSIAKEKSRLRFYDKSIEKKMHVSTRGQDRNAQVNVRKSGPHR